MLYGLMFCLALKYIKSLDFSYFLEKLGEKRKNCQQFIMTQSHYKGQDLESLKASTLCLDHLR